MGQCLLHQQHRNNNNRGDRGDGGGGGAFRCFCHSMMCLSAGCLLGALCTIPVLPVSFVLATMGVCILGVFALPTAAFV